MTAIALLDTAIRGAGRARNLAADPSTRLQLVRFASNLSRLKLALSQAASLLAEAPARDSALIRQINAVDRDSVRRPIAQAAVEGVVRALNRESSILRMQWSARLGSLYDEYILLREDLAARAAARPWSVGIAASGYEENVLGAGAVMRLESRRRQVLASASLLVDAADGWHPGGEVAAGLQIGEVGFLPGVVYLGSEGQRVGLSGSVLLLRPGGMAMGLSVSTLRGVGFKMVVWL